MQRFYKVALNAMSILSKMIVMSNEQETNTLHSVRILLLKLFNIFFKFI